MALPYEYCKVRQNVTQFNSVQISQKRAQFSHTQSESHFPTSSSVKDTSAFNIKYLNFSFFKRMKWNSPFLSYSDYVEEISKRRPHKVEILLIQFQLIPCKTFISLLEKF